MSITITEALAEIKTIGKRLEAKRGFICSNLMRMPIVIDPFASEGGSTEKLRRESQAISDLEQRIVYLRRAIAKANEETIVHVCGLSKTLAEWLTWRKEIAASRKQFLKNQEATIKQGRAEVRRQLQQAGQTQPVDPIINISESDLTKEIELLEEILGTLDGQLSLKNATTMIRD